MRKAALFLVFTILFAGCGYKVKKVSAYPVSFKTFSLKDPFLLRFKDEIFKNVREKVFQTGFAESDKPSSNTLQIFLYVENVRERTVQSGSDNRTTVSELFYNLKLKVKKGKKEYNFSDTVKVYDKFPVESDNFVDRRKEIAQNLSDQISLKVNAWLLSII